MKVRTHTRRRRLRQLALGLAVAAIAVPSAQAIGSASVAQVRPDGTPYHVPQSAASVNQYVPLTPQQLVGDYVATSSPSVSSVRPDDRANHGIGAQEPVEQPPTLADLRRFEAPFAGRPLQPSTDLRPYLTDGPRSIAPISTPATTPDSGIDWRDAGIGVAVGFVAGLVLLLAWSVLNRRRPMAHAS